MDDILKSIEAVTNKSFTGNASDLKDLILGLEAKSVFNSEDWSDIDEFTLKYLKELNLIYNVNTEIKPVKKKAVSILGSMPKNMPKEYGYEYSNKSYKNLRKIIKKIIYDNKITEIWTGLSQGTDWCVAHAVIEMRELGFPVKLCCAIPFAEYENLFKSKNLLLYQNIIRRADVVEVVSNEPYSTELFDKRNDFLLKKSQDIYFISTSNFSDFEREIKYAMEKNKEITKFDLENLIK